MPSTLGFARFRVLDLGRRLLFFLGGGLGLGVVGFRVWSLGLRVWGLGFGFAESRVRSIYPQFELQTKVRLRGT